MSLRPLIFLLAIAALAMGLGHPADVLAAAETVISGGGISQPIRLAQVDETALFQRVNLPPRLDEAQDPSGPSFNVRSPYWPRVLPGNGKDRPPALEEATYYPEGGFVRAIQGGRDAWLVLDLRQRAILDRYVQLGLKGLLPAEPGVVQVLTAAAASGEQIGIQADARTLMETQRQALWRTLEGTLPSPLTSGRQRRLDVPERDAWIIFVLPEGRDVRLYYDNSASQLVDFEGQQSYAVTDAWLPKILGPDATTGSSSYAPEPVPQDKGPGRPFWWLVMLGGGLALLAAAAYLSRGWARRQAQSS